MDCKSFSRIPNEVLESLSLINLSAYEGRVFMFVLRRTFGWHRKGFLLNVSKGAAFVCVQRPHFQRALRGLAGRSMIRLERNAERRVRVVVEPVHLWRPEKKGQVEFSFSGVI